MVVDLHRRRRMADRVLRLLVDLQVDRCAEECFETLSTPWKQNPEAYQLRYVFGYAMEGSDLSCYILGPHGQQNNPSGALMLAQTRVRFLSGGRGKSFHQLPPQEQASSKEEVYARATVVLSLQQNRFASSWSLWTCVGWLEQRLSLAVWDMVPASVGLVTRTALCSSSGVRIRISWRHLMIRPFCKAYGRER